jgi:fermentation-respiration switch protein FrsA (DUF1100 family)
MSLNALSQGAASRKYTVRGIFYLAVFTFSIPGILFGALFAKIQCFPGPSKAVRTPADLGLGFERLRLVASDGVPTVGWYLPPPSAPAPAVIVLHGHKGRKDDFLEQAAFLNRAGFGVAMFDMRHHGESGEAVVTFGVREADEVKPYLEFLKGRPEHAGRKIGVIGWSMGAVTALKAASLYPELAAIVADSPFAKLSEQSYWRVAGFVPRPFTTYAWMFTMATGCLLTGLPPSAWDVTRWLPALGQRPVFFIHGTDDNNIPFTQTEQLVSVIGRPVEMWYAKGVNHVDARKVYAKEYAERVTAFFRKTLN